MLTHRIHIKTERRLDPSLQVISAISSHYRDSLYLTDGNVCDWAVGKTLMLNSDSEHFKLDLN